MFNKKSKKHMLSVNDAENMNVNDIHKLYKNHVNSSKTELLSSFSFGNELIEKAKGQYIFAKSGKKILDFTGGIGVLNHGHNHPRILRARRNFSKVYGM